jgi:hypothetical protein
MCFGLFYSLLTCVNLLVVKWRIINELDNEQIDTESKEEFDEYIQRFREHFI